MINNCKKKDPSKKLVSNNLKVNKKNVINSTSYETCKQNCFNSLLPKHLEIDKETMIGVYSSL
jgi:hypothetical protein